MQITILSAGDKIRFSGTIKWELIPITLNKYEKVSFLYEKNFLTFIYEYV